MKKNGFTLAEVLITLAIIGVVAALTIPTLMTDSRYQLVSSRISKFVSVTEDAALAQAAMNGAISAGDIDAIVLYKERTGDPPYCTYQLKDGTSLDVYQNVNENSLASEFADAPEKYGTPIAGLLFYHNVSGISHVNRRLDFVMTNKGYIFPNENGDNPCAKALFDRENKTQTPWKLTKELAESTDACSK